MSLFKTEFLDDPFTVRIRAEMIGGVIALTVDDGLECCPTVNMPARDARKLAEWILART